MNHMYYLYESYESIDKGALTPKRLDICDNSVLTDIDAIRVINISYDQLNEQLHSGCDGDGLLTLDQA